MKLIDDKGRLFGRINLLDLAVLLGLLAILYVGASAWLALKTQRMELLELSPSKIIAGKPVAVTIKLKNERYIYDARLNLTTRNKDDKIISLVGKTRPNIRDHVTFTVPADLASGTYNVAFEARLVDVFRRSSPETVSNPKIRLTVLEEAKEVVVEKETFDSKCLWQIGFNASALFF